MMTLKRAYKPASPEDGVRYLVERLWPRGLKKTDLEIDGWLKDVAPSAELRRWFSHDPTKWQEFKRRYFAELDVNGPAWTPIRKAARRGVVTLVYSSHDVQHNAAVALRDYLELKTGGDSKRVMQRPSTKGRALASPRRKRSAARS
jgi:uncharacterized protein YeaO (DUF488 family)